VCRALCYAGDQPITELVLCSAMPVVSKEKEKRLDAGWLAGLLAGCSSVGNEKERVRKKERKSAAVMMGTVERSKRALW